jgi:hypothetical protein
MSRNDDWADRATAVKRDLARFLAAAASAGALAWGFVILILMMDAALDALRSRLVDELARR